MPASASQLPVPLPVDRPAGVTVVGVLCWVVGSLQLLAAVLMIVLLSIPGGSDMWSSRDALLASAIVYAVAGPVYLLVARAIWNGNDTARVVVLINNLLNGAIGLYAALTGQVLAGVLGIALALLITALLWTGPGRQYFEYVRADKAGS